MPALPDTPRAQNLILIGLLILGATLRLWEISAGLPYKVEVDEPAIMEKSLKMVRTGNPNPGFFDYGGVTFTMQAAVVSARFMAGALDHKFTKLELVWEGDFYRWGRIVTALLGTLTIYIVFLGARRWGAAVALVAAGAFAVQPQHILESHKALTDGPLVLFVALTMWLSLRAIDDGRARTYLLAGLAAGLATATKYNGIIAVLMPLGAAIAASTIVPRARLIATVIGGSAAGFLLGAPYTLLDLPHFLDNFAELTSHYTTRTDAWVNTERYLTYIRNWFGIPGVVTPYLTWPARLLTVLGVVVLVSRIRSSAARAAAVVMLPFPLVYFWFIANQSIVFGRYALPIAPMISVFLAIGIIATRDAIAGTPSSAARRTRVLLPLLLVLLMPFIQAARTVADRSKTSTMEQTAQWLVSHVKPEEPILLAVRGQDLRLPPFVTGRDAAHSPGRFQTSYIETPNDAALEGYRSKGAVYLVTEELDPGSLQRDAQFTELRRTLVQTFLASADHPGNSMLVFNIR